MQWRREESRAERPSLLKTVRGNRKPTSESLSIGKKITDEISLRSEVFLKESKENQTSVEFQKKSPKGRDLKFLPKIWDMLF